MQALSQLSYSPTQRDRETYADPAALSTAARGAASEPVAGGAIRAVAYPAIDSPRVTRIRFRVSRAVSSAVEHCFHTAGVTGSIPVPPTIQNKYLEWLFRPVSQSL